MTDAVDDGHLDVGQRGRQLVDGERRARVVLAVEEERGNVQ